MTIEVRSARPEDTDSISAIVAEALDPEDAAEARLVLTDPEFDHDRWLVATVDGRVASTLALFDSDLRIGGSVLPAGQIEFVATADDAQGRGLVRAQMDEVHRRSSAAGHLVQFIVGIPNFYRQFGYSYAVRQPAYQEVPADTPIDVGASWDARDASTTDIPAVVAAQQEAQADATVALTHSPAMWRWLIASPNYHVVIADTKAGTATGRIYDDGETAYLGDVVAPTKAALHGLIATARLVQPEVTVLHRPLGLLPAMLSAVGEHNDEHGWYYVRIGDVAAFVDAIRPELDARIAASPLADFEGTLTLSQYRSSVSCPISGGIVGAAVPGGPIPYPVSAGASGVPLDLVPDLVLGPHGASELELLHGDVLLGEQRALMDVLFPPATADIQTWVFP